MCGRMHYHSHWGKHHHHRKEAQKRWKHKFARWAYPPANVEELDDKYLISVYASGYQKADFQVKLRDDVLIVAVDLPGNDSENLFYNEQKGFKPGNFKKEFELNEKVNTEGITAKYEEGILEITLPKLEGFETVQKDIGVA